MLRKFASMPIISAQSGKTGETTTLRRSASRAVFNYEPRDGYIYVRSRAISSRCNDNYDEFPADEIKKGYKTFIGKPVFVNHHNDDHRGISVKLFFPSLPPLPLCFLHACMLKLCWNFFLLFLNKNKL